MQEKRKLVRIKWPVLVQYKTLEEPFTEDQVTGKDISEGGVCFIVYERLAKGTKLDMQLQVPFDSMPIFAKGKVAWVRKLDKEESRTFEAGIQFTEVDTRDLKRLKFYLTNEIKEKGQ